MVDSSASIEWLDFQISTHLPQTRHLGAREDGCGLCVLGGAGVVALGCVLWLVIFVSFCYGAAGQGWVAPIIDEC